VKVGDSDKKSERETERERDRGRGRERGSGGESESGERMCDLERIALYGDGSHIESHELSDVLIFPHQEGEEIDPSVDVIEIWHPPMKKLIILCLSFAFNDLTIARKEEESHEVHRGRGRDIVKGDVDEVLRGERDTDTRRGNIQMKRIHGRVM
jgi:hypothetical protein